MSGRFRLIALAARAGQGERRSRIVPLAPQVVEVLETLRLARGGPECCSLMRCCSWGSQAGSAHVEQHHLASAEAHGLSGAADRARVRGIASTALNEMGFRSDVIEAQLSRRIESNQVRAAYNHAQYMDERRELMVFWADYLDGCCR